MRAQLEYAYQPPTKPYAEGILVLPGEDARLDAVEMMQAAYSRIMQDRLSNLGVWGATRDEVVRSLRTHYEREGWGSAPLRWTAFWNRIDLPIPSSHPEEHVRLVEALHTDVTQLVADHCVHQLLHNANVHIAYCGPTGTGKSSGALGLADWIKPIAPGRLLDHVFIHDGDLKNRLHGKTRGDFVLKDEIPRTAGEGSRTEAAVYQNVEDTIRKSGICLARISPHRPTEEGTNQLVIETFAVNWQKKASLGLVWVEGKPLGVIALPWMRKELYEVYEPWKDANVEASLRGHFKDTEHTARTVMQLFEDERFTEYLWLGVNKPKMGDFNTAIVLFYPGMLTQGQVERMAKFAYEQCYGYERIKEKFHWFFGVHPNSGFEKIAAKCYEE